MKAVFITGTDTEIGKTTVTVAMLQSLIATGSKAIGMKPVAAGATFVNGRLLNDDADRLRRSSRPEPAYDIVNPCVYPAPLSPNIAATLAGGEVTLPPIARAFETCCKLADTILVEGIGGWRVPLSQKLQTVDLVRHLSLPVILVCGIRLGCINHALLTAAAIISDDVHLLGWIANTVDPEFPHAAAAIKTIESGIPAPLLATVPWSPSSTALITASLSAATTRIFVDNLG